MQQTEALLEAWLKQRTILEKLLLAIPDHHADFAPWDGAMTVSELAQHLGASADMFIRVAKTGEGQICMPQTVDCPSMKEVHRIVQEWTAKTTERFKTLTAEDLETVYHSPFPNLDGPRSKLVRLVIDHEIHHKGQLFVYARILGVQELPFPL
ncbi:DinB family protein [Paenibacillus thiaminolyticus]|uniref:DinB family protein n=1 Tax=Paenibacillus thiaminolyticus TaxID=49283 RepID=UPI00235076B4|nr:DinB family protein [Paenibacillus thiaminolyticus]WCR27539.1 DinB family protein [Paenibacillus thiaminolyticus]